MKTAFSLVFFFALSLNLTDAFAQDYRQGRRRTNTPAQQQPAAQPGNRGQPTNQLGQSEENSRNTTIRERARAPKYVTARIFVKPNKSAEPKDLQVRLKGRGIVKTPDENGVVEFEVQPNQTVPIEVESKNYANTVVDMAIGTSSRELEIEIKKLGFFQRLFGKK